MTAEIRARRHLRIAVAVGTLAPGYEFIRFVLTDGSLFHEAAVFLALLAFAVVPPFLWFIGLDVIRVGSIVFHAIFGRGIPSSRWNEATFEASWTLPIAASLGTAAWLAYSHGHFGGGSTDVVFGMIANAIIGWCCGTFVWNWFMLGKQEKGV